jgi:hypothetical protein
LPWFAVRAWVVEVLVVESFSSTIPGVEVEALATLITPAVTSMLVPTSTRPFVEVVASAIPETGKI